VTAIRRLAAILAGDVAGYSRLIGADETGTLGRLRTIRTELIDPAIAAHNGRLVKTTGDGFLVEYGSVVDALRSAIEIQAGIAERNAPIPQDQRIELGIGLNVGDGRGVAKRKRDGCWASWLRAAVRPEGSTPWGQPGPHQLDSSIARPTWCR